jgi:hypothetical protein
MSMSEQPTEGGGGAVSASVSMPMPVSVSVSVPVPVRDRPALNDAASKSDTLFVQVLHTHCTLHCEQGSLQLSSLYCYCYRG